MDDEGGGWAGGEGFVWLSLAAGFRKRRSDGGSDARQTRAVGNGCSGAKEGVEAAELVDLERDARNGQGSRVDGWVGGVGWFR
jgi:hypothetical protein